MILTLGLIVIALAVIAVIRNVDVRLTLIVAALVLGTLAGAPANIVRKFFQTLAAEEFLIPICAAMGFARFAQSVTDSITWGPIRAPGWAAT